MTAVLGLTRGGRLFLQDGMTATITKTFTDGAGDPVDPTSVKLSNAAGTAGVTVYATGEVVVADGAVLTRDEAGSYSAAFAPSGRNVLHAIYIEIVYLGHTLREMQLWRSAPHDDAEPILEQLAQWWLAKLATVTSAAGYYQDLGTPTRPEDSFWAGSPTTDLSCELVMGEASDVESGGGLVAYSWRQTFYALVYLAGQVGDDVTDTRIARIVHDIHGLVAAEIAASTNGTYCNALADGLAVGPHAIAPLERDQLTLVRVPIVIDYHESVTDPTQQ